MNHGTCIHFTGLSFAGGTCKCKAGVDYRLAFDGDRPGIMLRAPCIEFRTLPAHGRGTCCKPGEPTIRKEVDRHDEVAMKCAHRLEPTTEQVEQDLIETEQSFKKMLAGLQVANEWRVKPKPATNRREIVECPVCKGKLHLSQSAYNGHVHGRCETVGCVSWME
jgi:hypothetical protein